LEATGAIESFIGAAQEQLRYGTVLQQLPVWQICGLGVEFHSGPNKHMQQGDGKPSNNNNNDGIDIESEIGNELDK
jgi:hypothetical protein